MGIYKGKYGDREGKAKEYIYRSFCALPRRRRDGVDFVRCQGESISPSRFPLAGCRRLWSLVELGISGVFVVGDHHGSSLARSCAQQET